MNKNKATHSGHCQGCGSFQKLPNGTLAKHGYTTKWGFFSGTCGGSEYPPYELSCDYIEVCIDSARSRLESMKKIHADLLLPNLDENAVAYHHFLVHYERYRTREENHRVKFLTEEGRLYMIPADLSEEKIAANKDYKVSVYRREQLDAVNNLRYVQALQIENTIAQIKDYIAYQEGRVRDWILTDLTPVKA